MQPKQTGQIFKMDFANKEERQKFFSELPDNEQDILARHLAYAFAVSGTLPCEGVVKSNAWAVYKGIGRAMSGRLQWDKEGHIPMKDSLRKATEAHMKFAKAVIELVGDHPKRGEVTKAFLFRDEQGLFDLSWELESEWKKWQKDMETAKIEGKMLEEEAKNLQCSGRHKEANNKQKEADKRLKKARGMKAKIQKATAQHESLVKGILLDPKKSQKQALDRAIEMDLSDLKEVMADSTIKHAKNQEKYTSEEWLDDFFKKLVLMTGQANNSELEDHVKSSLKDIPGCKYRLFKDRLEEFSKNKWISPSTVIKRSNIILNRKDTSMEASFHGGHSTMNEGTFHKLMCEKWPEIRESQPYISRDLERLEQPSISEEKTSFGNFFKMMVQESDASQKNQVVFNPGDPCMGKTTFAEHLAHECKNVQTHPLHWVFLLTRPVTGDLKGSLFDEMESGPHWTDYEATAQAFE